MTVDPLAAYLAELPGVEDNDRLEYGIVTAVAGTTVTVNLSGRTIICPFLNSYPATVGDTAAVIRVGLYAVAIGATTRATPTVGTVTANGAGTVTVTVNGTAGLVMRYLSSYSPTNGDIVQVVDGGVIGAYATAPVAPVAPEPPPVPPPPAMSGTTVFLARDAGTWRSGWRTDNSAVFQGSTVTGANSGAWFYGTAPADSLGGATVLSASIWLHRVVGSGVDAAQDVHMWLHNSATRPGGDVTRTGGPRNRSLSVGDRGWYDLGADWGQDIVDAVKRGVGITGSPYLQLASIADDAQSGAIKIVWSL